MRATFNTTFRLLQASLDRSNRSLEDLRVQAATGKKVQKPSDEPTSIRPILAARTQIKGYERYLKNISVGLSRTDTTDVPLSHMENTLVRAKEIAIAAVNGAMSATDLATYADEVSQLRKTMLDSANSKFDGKYLFSGFLVTDASMGNQAAFVTNPAYTAGSGLPPVLYNGDDNSTLVEISPSEQLTIGVPGEQFLAPAGGEDVFAGLARLEEALRANDRTAVGAEIDRLEVAAEQVRTQRSLLGNVGKRLQDAQLQTTDIKLDKQELLSKFEDADLVDVISNLQQQEQAYQAALNITGKLSKLTILDYI